MYAVMMQIDSILKRIMRIISPFTPTTRGLYQVKMIISGSPTPPALLNLSLKLLRNRK